MSSDADRLLQPIVALATGRGAAAIAMIRLSGPQSLELLLNHLEPKSLKPWHHGQARYCNFYEHSPSEPIDDVIVISYAQGKSYTGEESCEICCHGGPFIVNRILQVLQSRGFLLAEAGEFTRRAYLNGRMDLTQAEGVNALIHAVSEQQLQAGRFLSDARLAKSIHELRADLTHAMAYLEASIDFPDEGDTKGLDLGPVLIYVHRVKNRLENLRNSYSSGHVMLEGLRVLFCGVPNAGKSTMLNAFLRKERALVSDIPGTTRDYLEENCLLRGRLAKLIDTAGLRKTDDHIELKGIEQSLRLAKEADIVVLLYPSTMNADEKANFDFLVKDLEKDKVLGILTKADLANPLWAEGMPQIARVEDEICIKPLEELLIARIDQEIENFSKNEVSLVTERQKNCVDHALKHILSFEIAVAEGQYEECLAFELQSAARSLTDMVGVISSDDILDRVFSTFCVGK